MPTSACPSRGEMAAYAVGKLPPERSEEIDMHLHMCTECQKSLETCGDDGDTLLSRLQHPAGDEDFLDETECQQVVARVAAIGREPSFATRQTLEQSSDEQADFGRVGPYRFLARLGEGGMGTVYKALHTKLKRVVALKLLPRDRMEDPQAIARFEREMEAAGKLDHPRIVRASDANEEDGVHYLVMEYVDGEDLSELAGRWGRLGIADACEIIRQAAEGLQYAYEHGLVHRDVKPSNLMLTSGGQVKVLDLGLALLEPQPGDQARELTSTGQTMGTLDYMAPEQGDDSHQVDIRADVYSLGATLYRLLSGRAPFAGAKHHTPMAKLMALATEDPEPLLSLRPELPAELAAIVHRMLSKQPGDRPATPAEVAEGLAPWCEGNELAALLVEPTFDRGSGETDRGPGRTQAERSSSATDGSTDHDTGSSLTPVAGPKPARASGRRRLAVLATGLALAAMVAFGVVLTMQTPYGTVTVEAADEDVQVIVKQGGKQIDVIDADSNWSIKLREGQYEIELRGGDDKLRLDKDIVTVTRRGKVHVKVELKRAEIAGRVKPVPGALKPVPGWGDRDLAGIIPQPADLPGIGRWQVETVSQRDRPQGLAWSPDSQRFAVGEGTGYVRIYEAGISRLVGLLAGHEQCVSAVAWDPQDRWIAAAAADGSIRQWRPDGAPLRVLHGKGSHVNSLACSRDGKWLASAREDGTIRLWQADGAAGPVIVSGSSVSSVAWSPDGRWLASAHDDKTVRLWQADGTAGPAMEGHEGAVLAVAWKPDSQMLASGGKDQCVRVWHVDGTAGPVLCEYPGWVKCLAWSPDGKRIVLGGDHGTRDWEPDGSKDAATPWSGGRYLVNLVWSPDGKWLAAVDVFGHRVNLLTSDGRRDERADQGPWHTILTLAWNRDGQWLAAGCNDGWVRLWGADPQRRKQINPWGWVVRPLAWHPDGKQLAAGHGGSGIKILDFADTPRQTMAFGWDEKEINSLDWSSDGKWLASGYHDGAVRFWTPDGNLAVVREDHEGLVRCVAWSPDGNRLASGSDDKTIRLWNSKGEPGPVITGPASYIEGLAWSPDGNLLASGSQDGSVRVWDVSGEPKPVFEKLNLPHTASVAWSPDGTWLASGHHEGKIRLWQRDGTPGRVLSGHKTMVFSLAWSPDGRWLVSGDQLSGVACFRDTDNFEIQRVIATCPGGESLTLSRHGEVLAGDLDAAEDRVVFLVEKPNGAIDLLTPAEFQGLAGEAVRNAKKEPNGRIEILTPAEIQQRAAECEIGDDPEKPGTAADSSESESPPLASDGETSLPGIIPEPAALPGSGRWQVETNWPRSGPQVVSWHPSGDRIACGTWSGRVRIYDAQSYKLVGLMRGGSDPVGHVAWSPDGQWLVSVGKDGARLWHADGRPAAVLDDYLKQTLYVAWSPDSQWLLFGGSDGSVRLRGLDGTEQPAWKTHDGKVLALDWSPTGDRFVSAGEDKTLRIWRTDGTVEEVLTGHADSVRSVAWHPDGRWIASGSADNTVRLWQADGTPGPVLEGHTSSVNGVAWSSDGQSLASSSWGDESVRLWQVDGTPGPVCKTGEHASSITWSPDSLHFAVVYSWAKALMLWNIDGTMEAKISPHRINALSRERTGARIASGTHHRGVCIWNPDGSLDRVIEEDKQGYGPVAWNPQNPTLALGWHDHIQLLKNGDGPDTEVRINAYSHTLAWHPDGKRLASGHFDRKIRLWHEDGTPGPVLAGHEGGVWSVAWSNDGDWLASCGENGVIRFWRPDGVPGPVVPTDSLWGSVAWNPRHHTLAVGGGSSTLRVWEVDDEPKLVSEWDTGDHVHAVAWSSDGAQLATGMHDGIRLWQPDGTPGPELGGHSQMVVALAWSPDGRSIVSGSITGVIRFWDVASGQCRAVGVVGEEGRATSFNARGEPMQDFPEGIENDIRYLLEQPDGRIEVLSPAEFQARAAEAANSAADNRPEMTEREAINWVYRVGGAIYPEGKSPGNGDSYPTAADVPDGAEDLTVHGEFAADDVARLAHIPGVRCLIMSRVEEGSLSQVPALPDLETLMLRSEADDAGLACLRDCPALTRLYLNNSPVTDDGMRHIAAMRALDQFVLQNTKVTDRGLEIALEGQQQLGMLSLDNSDFSDGILEPIARHPSLCSVHLRNNNITDAGLEHLYSASNLGRLSLTGTKVTERGVEKLRQALPNCEISWHPTDVPAVPPTGAEQTEQDQ